MHCVLCSCVDIVCGHPQHYIQRCIVETNLHPYTIFNGCPNSNSAVFLTLYKKPLIPPYSFSTWFWKTARLVFWGIADLFLDQELRIVHLPAFFVLITKYKTDNTLAMSSIVIICLLPLPPPLFMPKCAVWRGQECVLLACLSCRRTALSTTYQLCVRGGLGHPQK